MLSKMKSNSSLCERMAKSVGPFLLRLSGSRAGKLGAVAVLGLLWLAATEPALMSQDRQPELDLLIKGGRVLDPKNAIDALLDVGIAGSKIVRVEKDIPEGQAKRVVSAKGLYVTPGLIDMHVHVFFGTDADAAYSNGPNALPPDGFTFRNGVTTVVDTGGSGWRNFPVFKRQVIEASRTRVLALLNIVGSGMRGDPHEQDLADMDSKLTAMRIKENPGVLVGVKVAHYAGPEWDPVDRAVEAGRLADVLVMVDFGGHTPELPLEDLFLKHLRPGDIFTHAYATVKGRIAVVDEQGRLRPYLADARRRGIVFDVGHGGASLAFAQAEPALRQGFLPDTISTDLHRGSMNGGMKDLLNVMSKFLNMGMTVPQVVACASWNPARSIHRADLGHLTPGSGADLALLRVREGEFGFLDASGRRMAGKVKLECELTLRDGVVVWDLNGLAADDWMAGP